MQAYAGVGAKGTGLGNEANARRRPVDPGRLDLRHLRWGSFLTHLLLLMVLSSAAASTQTTILPTARTTLSMAV